MITKTRVLYVQPKSDLAKERFYEKMHHLHSCKVDRETDTQFFLSSITGQYQFCIDKVGDTNWELIK